MTVPGSSISRSATRAITTAIKASLFTALALGTIAMSACGRSSSRPRQTDPAAFAWNGDLAAPGTVAIRNTNGAITVEPSADKGVHVVAATSWTRGDPKKDVKFEVVTSGNAVTVCAIWDNGTCSTSDYESGKKSGHVNFRWSSKSDASVAFTVQVPTGVKVDAMTVSGTVGVRASAPVKARTIDGNVKVGTSVGPVDAEALNGDVDIRMTTIGEDGPVRAVTKNGTATAWVPEIKDGTIDASTLNGELGTDFGGPTDTMGHMREFKTTIGAGARNYEIQTLNGSAWLRLINADGTVAGAGAAAASATVPKAAPKAPRPPLPNRRNQ